MTESARKRKPAKPAKKPVKRAPKRTETDRQRIFVDEYLACWNASEAARRAGYSRRSAGQIGHENLKKHEIQAAIEARLAEKHLSADEVLAMLSDIAHADIREFVRTARNGEPLRFDLRPGRPLHLVKKISITVQGTSIELHDRMTALVKIGEHHKLFAQQIKFTGWQDEVIQLLRDGRVTVQDVVTEFGEQQGHQFAIAAGIWAVAAGAAEGNREADEPAIGGDQPSTGATN
jgi:phage terminase small subunit